MPNWHLERREGQQHQIPSLCVYGEWHCNVEQCPSFATGKTRHDIALGLIEDQLKLWQELNCGWALWGLYGGFGILDSERDDVDYEDFHGHKLDRQLLELLQRY